VIIARGKIRADGRPDSLRARAADHNAVIITAKEADAETIRHRVADIPAVKSVAVVGTVDGVTKLCAYPKSGKPIATGIADIVRGDGLPVQEIFVEQGSLDDVFWDMTASDSAPGAGRA
jgi:ABC-2 type transport system ATP-binding protein